MMLKMPDDALRIIEILASRGFEAYAVGGCVRDSVMGREPHDWDICSAATPEQVKEAFSAPGFHVIDTGIQHGTVTVLLNGEPYEVTTFRTEGVYLDNRRPSEVRFVSSLKEDLGRRDFTINAMAYNPSAGLSDFYGGLADLEAKCIRCVGNPEERFREDALRMMRALRFASVFGFEIEAATAAAILNQKELLKQIAAERIHVELNRLLCGKGAEHILMEYFEVLVVFMPELQPMAGFQQNNPHHFLDVWAHTARAVAEAPDDVVLRLVMLFHDIGKPMSYSEDEEGIGHFYGHQKHSADLAEVIMKRLKYDNSTISQVLELVLYHDSEVLPKGRNVKRWLNRIGEVRLRQLLRVKAADALAQSERFHGGKLARLQAIEVVLDQVIAQQQCFSLKDLAVNGRDVMNCGITEGAQIGAVLKELMELVIEEQIENDREMLLAEIERRALGG